MSDTQSKLLTFKKLGQRAGLGRGALSGDTQGYHCYLH